MLIERVEDQAGEKREAGLLPVIREPLPVRITKHLRDVLCVCHFMRRAEADLLQEVEPGAPLDGAELQPDDDIIRVLRPPAGGQLPQLAFLVIDRGAGRPGQEGRVDVADTLSAAGRRDDDAVLGTVMPQVVRAPLSVGPAADIDARVLSARPLRHQPAFSDVSFGLESRRAMNTFVLPGPASYRGGISQTAEKSDGACSKQAGVHDLKGALGIGRPRGPLPLDPAPRGVEMPEEGCPDRRVIADPVGDELGRRSAQDEGTHDQARAAKEKRSEARSWTAGIAQRPGPH